MVVLFLPGLPWYFQNCCFKAGVGKALRALLVRQEWGVQFMLVVWTSRSVLLDGGQSPQP